MNAPRRSSILPVALVAVVLGGCAFGTGRSPDASPTDEVDEIRPPFETMLPLDAGGGPTGPPATIPDEAWAALLEDLSDMLDRPIDDPTVISAQAVTYNDGSLGCPEPGQVYTQALVEGYRVIVEVDGAEYDFRIGRGTDVRLCESGSTPSDDDV